jgi:PKHD-type hydroxylase
MQYYIRKVLEKEQLVKIDNILNECNIHNQWVDGLNSGGGVKSVKNNLELSCIDSLNKINDMIMSSLDCDINFLNFTAAKSTHLNIISKTETGGYYNPHIDTWSNGDYSTTVFLSDPESYSGGELCLLLDNQEEKMIKLEKGWAITYSTGILHRVNVITRGTRYVSVFWTNSLLKDSFHRHIYSQLGKLKVLLECEVKSDPTHYKTCQQIKKNPYFIVDSLQHQILRKYSS